MNWILQLFVDLSILYLYFVVKKFKNFDSNLYCGLPYWRNVNVYTIVFLSMNLTFLEFFGFMCCSFSVFVLLCLTCDIGVVDGKMRRQLWHFWINNIECGRLWEFILIKSSDFVRRFQNYCDLIERSIDFGLKLNLLQFFIAFFSWCNFFFALQIHLIETLPFKQKSIRNQYTNRKTKTCNFYFHYGRACMKWMLYYAFLVNQRNSFHWINRTIIQTQWIFSLNGFICLSQWQKYSRKQFLFLQRDRISHTLSLWEIFITIYDLETKQISNKTQSKCDAKSKWNECEYEEK